MKKGGVLILGIFTFISCTTTTKKAEAKSGEEQQVKTQAETPKIGGEKDDHGCLTAAGETWSELNQTCLRLFDQGLRLNPVQVEGSAVISAFVVFNADQSKLQLFLPTEAQQLLILDKKEGNVYQDATYTFDGTEGVLYINGEKKYAK
ncbi:hypothetical protein ACPDHL_08665 [Myroides sp. C15-4]|uniref:hypothetical protein n=1 Tax=Myroides sp. C15-4 TaxID=3400532 RepID=UPI003D2F9BAC